MGATSRLSKVVVSSVQQSISHLALHRVAWGWLLSAVVHTLLLVVLAVVTLDNRAFSPFLVIRSSYSELEAIPELRAAVHIEPPEQALASTWHSDSDLYPRLPEPGTIVPVLPGVDPDGFSAAEIFGEQSGAGAMIQGGGGSPLGDGQAGTQFFGVQAGGSDFVFVVDSSVSMRLKFAEALRELEYSLRSLTPSQRFYVIFFDHNAERMTLGKWNRRHTQYSMKLRPEPDMVPATDENIDGCVRWMHHVQLEQWTNPHTAMAFALERLHPDAIFLLSDGEFTDDGLTEQFLKEKNMIDDPVHGPLPAVIIHCIGFFSRAGEVTLQRIADTYGGTYRFVGPPAG